MARQKIGKKLVEHLDNYTKAIGFNLGKIVKEAHQGAGSSYTRKSYIEDFFGDSLSSEWNLADVSASGTPTYNVATGADAYVMTLASTDEVESLLLSFADICNFDITKKPYFEAYVKFTRSGAAASYAYFGLASAISTNTTETLLNSGVATNAWFRLNDTGTALTVTVESDDATTDTNSKAIVNVTPVSGTYYKFAVNASDLNNVKFLINDILVATTSIAAATDKVQPMFILGKASGASVASLAIDYVKIECDR